MRAQALFLVISCVLFAPAEGSPAFSIGRCKCFGPKAEFIPLKLIGTVEVLPVSTTCEQIEIIVTMKGSKEERCLNPRTHRMQTFVTKLLKGRFPHAEGKANK